jgi:molybdenum cofactor synthesis domain-containing protein
MKKIKVLSVNVSFQKGTIKHPVPDATLTPSGIEGDAHAGTGNRQVSLLDISGIQKFEKETGRKITFGEFAENITTEGLDFNEVRPLDRFCGECFELEVTRIGKPCHGIRCAIYTETGDCIMPKEGIFTRVLTTKIADDMATHPASFSLQAKGSNDIPKHQTDAWKLEPGIVLNFYPKVYSARIITLSDRASRGEYEDQSGPCVKALLEKFFIKSEHSRFTSHITVLPDDREMLRSALAESIESGTDFIFTTGGTGIAPRDFTPDVVKPILEKEIPGIMEMIRVKYGAQKPQALLSRSVAGIAGKTLIFTLPGSVKAVNEYMDEILPSLMHMVYMLHGLDIH